MRQSAPEIIQALKRVRVRQGENAVALMVLAQYADALMRAEDDLGRTAADVKRQALELKRLGNAIPRFMVEDLVLESIARFEESLKK